MTDTGKRGRDRSREGVEGGRVRVRGLGLGLGFHGPIPPGGEPPLPPPKKHVGGYRARMWGIMRE